MFTDERRKKERLVRSISDQFKRTIKITALTVGLVTPVMLFAQGSGCDTSDDCIIVIGNPPPNPPPPGYDGPTPGCDYLGDSDCDDSGGGGSGGGGSGSNPSPAQCFALEQSKPDNCYSDPLVNPNTGNPRNFINYTPWINSNFGSINPNIHELDSQGQLVQVRAFRYLTYVVGVNVIHQMSQSYMNTGSYVNSRGGIWNALGNYCQNHNIPANDRNECLQEQADFMSSLHPDPNQGGGSWGGSVSWGAFSASIGGTTPSGNWVSNFLNKVQADKQCNLWFQHPHQDGCND